MKRFFLVVGGALAGICLAIAVHCSFMVVEAAGSGMLPTVAPGQKALVYLLADKAELKVGDVVAYRQPYYVVDGENGILLRRVDKVTEDEVILTCDAEMADRQNIAVKKEEILGKAIMF